MTKTAIDSLRTESSRILTEAGKALREKNVQELESKKEELNTVLEGLNAKILQDQTAQDSPTISPDKKDALQKLIEQAQRNMDDSLRIDQVNRYIAVTKWANALLSNEKISDEDILLVKKELDTYSCFDKIFDSKLGRAVAGIAAILLGLTIIGLCIYGLSKAEYIPTKIDSNLDPDGIGPLTLGIMLGLALVTGGVGCLFSPKRKDLGLEIKRFGSLFPAQRASVKEEKTEDSYRDGLITSSTPQRI